MTMRKEQSIPLVVLVALVAIVIGGGVVLGASGGDDVTQPSIDNFEDGDLDPHPGWSGWNDPTNSFSTTSNAINETTSAVFEPSTGSNGQTISVTRASNVTQNGSLVVDVRGQADVDATHRITWYEGNRPIANISYEEINGASDDGRINISAANFAGGKVDTFDESTKQIQRLRVDFDFSSDSVEFYINGSSVGGTTNLPSNIDGWDRFEINSSVPTTSSPATASIKIDNVGADRTTHEPIVDDEKQTPTGKLQSRQVQVEAPIRDAEFPSTSDEVTVEIIKDTQTVDTQTITSNQTVSTTMDFTTAGGHGYRFIAEDEFGNRVIGNLTTVEVPANLTVRNESDPDQIIDNVQASVQFYANGQLINRTTNNGKFNLTGLPTGKTIVAEVEAPGYRSRRVLLPSLYSQQSIYLLNKSISASDINFRLDDATGDFISDGTQLAVQRALNQSNSTEWRTVVADEIGADKELPTTLHTPERYRLVATSTEGETRTLGSYQADGPEDPEIIPIGSLTFSTETEAQTAVGAKLTETNSGRQIRFVYTDQQDATTELNITIQNRRTGNTLLDTSIQDPTRRHIETVSVPAAARDNDSWNVSYNAVRVGQQNVSGKLLVGDTPDPAQDFPLSGDILTYGAWLFLFAISAWLGLRSPRAAPFGSTVTATALTIIGALSIPAVFLGLAGATSTAWFMAGGDGI